MTTNTAERRQINRSCTYYLVRKGHVIELRQVRYRAQYLAGREHPHDVIAMYRDKQQAREMAVRHGLGPVDWDSIEEDIKEAQHA